MEEIKKLLTEICNTVITEEDCKKQIIQDALNVSNESELRELWNDIMTQLSPMIEEKNDCDVVPISCNGESNTEEKNSCDEIPISSNGESNTEEKKSSNGEKENTSNTENEQFEDLSRDEGDYGTVIPESDTESVMVIISFLCPKYFIKNVLGI